MCNDYFKFKASVCKKWILTIKTTKKRSENPCEVDGDGGHDGTDNVTFQVHQSGFVFRNRAMRRLSRNENRLLWSENRNVARVIARKGTLILLIFFLHLLPSFFIFFNSFSRGESCAFARPSPRQLFRLRRRDRSLFLFPSSSSAFLSFFSLLGRNVFRLHEGR